MPRRPTLNKRCAPHFHDRDQSHAHWGELGDKFQFVVHSTAFLPAKTRERAGPGPLRTLSGQVKRTEKEEP